jgi:hypothetical protein
MILFLPTYLFAKFQTSRNAILDASSIISGVMVRLDLSLG